MSRDVMKWYHGALQKRSSRFESWHPCKKVWLVKNPIVCYTTQLMGKFTKSIQLLALIPVPFISLFGGDSIWVFEKKPVVLAEYEMSLENRYENGFVNEVFKNNILLNLAYMEGRLKPARDVSWDEVKKDSSFEFTLEPDKTFAYHDDVLPKYQDSLVKTSNAHFNAQEGFKTDGYLFGDGICHLASLIYMVAKNAGLLAEAPTNHDFRAIPDIPKEYGVSIFSNPYAKGSNTRQNLYITNNKGKPISFKFEYNGEKIKVAILE